MSEQRRNVLKNRREITRIAHCIGMYLKNVPVVGIFLRAFKKKMQWLALRMRIAYRTRKLGIPVGEVIHVDPKRIVYCTKYEFSPLTDIGRVVNSDWDQSEIKFNELDIYQAMNKRYFEGVEWVDTEFYGNTLRLISSGTVLWGCSSESDWNNRLLEIDRLFNNIKQNGYRSQLELNGGKLRHLFEDIDEISVNLDRDGRMLFNNSAHRLAIAKLLNIPSVAVVITVRRPESAALRV